MPYTSGSAERNQTNQWSWLGRCHWSTSRGPPAKVVWPSRRLWLWSFLPQKPRCLHVRPGRCSLAEWATLTLPQSLEQCCAAWRQLSQVLAASCHAGWQYCVLSSCTWALLIPRCVDFSNMYGAPAGLCVFFFAQSQAATALNPGVGTLWSKRMSQIHSLRCRISLFGRTTLSSWSARTRPYHPAAMRVRGSSGCFLLAMDSIRCKLGPHSVVSRSRRRATFRPVHIPCLLSQHLAACDASAWPRVDDEGLDRGISSFIAQAVEGCTKDSYLADRPYAFVVSTSGFNIGPRSRFVKSGSRCWIDRPCKPPGRTIHRWCNLAACLLLGSFPRS